MPELSIIYEDNSLLILNKPSGLMVEPDRFGNPSVAGDTEIYFKQKRVSQNTIIGIVHRLDRPVSGVLLIAKKKSVLLELNNQFEAGKIDKVYHALVENAPEKNEDNLHHYLKKDPANKKAIIYKNKKPQSLKCELIYKVVTEDKDGCLLEIHPLTGKYHQIRAQLSFIGCPIIGDEKYGSKKRYKADAICLHASSIEFYHPVEKKMLQFHADLPADWKIRLP